MNTNEHKYEIIKRPLLTEIIIGCAIKVHNALGAGYLEKVYENALLHELKNAGLFVEQQKHIPVKCDGVVVGDYVADLIVEKKVILELKACSSLSSEFTSCLLMNFAKPRLDWKRLVGDTYINEPFPL